MLLNILPALNGSPNRVVSRILPVRQLAVDWWPHDNHGITDKLDDIASVLVQISDHAFHVAIDAKS